MNGRDRLNRFLDRYLLRITVGLLVGLFVFLLFVDRMVVSIPAGHRGVLFHRFSGDTRIYPEGVRLKWPWDLITVYEVRWQNVERQYVAIDEQGLSLDLQVSTLIQANIGDEKLECAYGAHDRDLSDEPCLGRLHKAFGPEYIERLVVPVIGSHIRAVVGAYTATRVYASRTLLEDEIEERVKLQIEEANFDLVRLGQVFIRQIILPPIVTKAIEEKISQQHAVAREAAEANRKELEASGIRIFQDTVAQSLTEPFLRWHGIQATLKLAESPNAKVVIIGSGPQGLPVILGGEAGPPPPPVAPPRAQAPEPTRPAGVPAAAGAAAPAAPAAPPEQPVAAKPTEAPAAPGPAPAEGVRGFLDRILGLGR
jgi:regulator of protease activity HflC (stomatin/prohibitin superfamily)